MDAVVASRKEQALWLLEKFVPDSGVNNLSMVFQVDGDLRPDVLQRVLDHLVRRHEVLRTVFLDGGDALRRRVLGPDAVRIEVQDLTGGTAGRAGEGDAGGGEAARSGAGGGDAAGGAGGGDAAGTVEEQLTPFIAEPFTTDGSPLLRAAHLRRADGDVCCVAVHHSIFDAASSMILLTEFTRLYEALLDGGAVPAELAGPVPVWTEPAPAEGSEAFWRQQLDGFRPTELGLWCEKNTTSAATLDGGVVNHTLSPEARSVVRRLQRQLRAPEAVILLAAYTTLLAAHGAGPDLTVGSPVSVRGRDAQDRIGYHINVLTLRTPVDRERTFREHVTATRKTFLGALGHADYPVDELLGIVDRGDAAWRNLLFRHVFNYAPMDAPPEFSLAGQKATRLTIENGSSKFDLEFFVFAGADGLRVRAAYYTDVFDREDVEALLRRYESLLLRLDTEHDRPIGEVSAWSDHDREVIGAANATGRADEPPAVPAAVAARAAAHPDAVAFRDGERAVRYGELWAAAVATRERLAAAGVVPGDVVALAARRGPELAAAALGVWLAGGAYLPLEPSHPEQRLAYQLDDSGARAVLAGPGVTVPGERRTVLPLPEIGAAADAAGGAAADPVGGAVADAAPGDSGATAADVPAVDADTCAYLIYTSGSTGRPKGTLVGHGALANLVAHFADELRATADDRTLWLTTFSFDISALELFVPLVTGGTVVVAPDEARTDGAAFAACLAGQDVDILQATPTTWRMVVDEVADQLAGRRVLSGGEPLPATLARQLAATGCELRNVYGPTETTIWSTSGVVDPAAERVDVGGPIARTTLFMADPAGRELPVGVRGELCIAGAGVAQGYHARPELTAERFGEHPRYGRFYRTGDLARWLPDGQVEVLGRADRQIKLRGNRIELGEVESVLLGHPDVRGAAVVVAGDPTADAVLAAFVVTGRPDAVGELWEHARAALPLSAVPQEYVAVESFPMTGNNKVDYPELARRAEERLRRADAAAAGSATGDGAARHDDELVDRLVKLWETLLRRDGVAQDANFFASGGHSLLGAKLVQDIQGELGVKLKLTDLFDHPTPVALAARIRAVAPPPAE